MHKTGAGWPQTTEGEQRLNTDWKAPPSFTHSPKEGNIFLTWVVTGKPLFRQNSLIHN